MVGKGELVVQRGKERRKEVGGKARLYTKIIRRQALAESAKKIAGSLFRLVRTILGKCAHPQAGTCSESGKGRGFSAREECIISTKKHVLPSRRLETLEYITRGRFSAETERPCTLRSCCSSRLFSLDDLFGGERRRHDMKAFTILKVH